MSKGRSHDRLALGAAAARPGSGGSARTHQHSRYGRAGQAGSGLGSKGPQRIANVLSELMAKQGFARIQSTECYEEAWREAAGPLAAQYTRVGALRRGCLEILVANSTLMQELTFQKTQLLEKLVALLPNQGIRSLRLRQGSTS